jgi:transposase
LLAGDVFHARLILALANGESHRGIVRSLKTSTATIARWKTRFEQDRLAGLEGHHRGSKPRTASAAVQACVIRRVQQQPKDGSAWLEPRIETASAWNATWPAMSRISKPRLLTSLACT